MTNIVFPEGMLICPVCASDLEGFACPKCGSEFFALGGIPCVFPAGLQQKSLWQHQMAMIEQQGTAALDKFKYMLEGYDLTARTRDRLEVAHDAMGESLMTIVGLLKEGGLVPERSDEFEQVNVDDPTEYYHHILRDWAWDEQPSKHFEKHANDANLQRVLNIWPEPKAKKMLFLGAGAGRLSWDLHKELSPELTIASDINPFLLSTAESLIKARKPITLPELCTYPQIGFPYSESWLMSPPSDESNLRARWFSLGADVWNMPLKEGSVDTIVTSWLLDVTGGDVKDLISVLAYLLEPGGQWVNTGPLLYSSHLSFDKKYSSEEILEFADMAGFDVLEQSVEEVAHMASPLNARYHWEQIFSFSARKRVVEKPSPTPSRSSEWLTPAWLVMHHQAIPKMDFECEIGHAFIEEVLALVDGQRSIYLISQMVQSSLPEGVDAQEAVVALFGQILEQMVATDES